MWLNEDLPIDYGRELLGADKYKINITINNINDTLNFKFEDILSGNLDRSFNIFEYIIQF